MARTKRNEAAPRRPIKRLEPQAAYKACMLIVRDRLRAAEGVLPEESDLARAERLALHARKIVEGLAFAALSAAEWKNPRLPPNDRTSDADTLLKKLHSRGLLRLPAAQWSFPNETLDVKLVFHGNTLGNLHVDDMLEIFSRSSSVLHERHPERLTAEWIGDQLRALRKDIERLKTWLWKHIIFIDHEAFMIRMGLPEESFFTFISKETT